VEKTFAEIYGRGGWGVGSGPGSQPRSLDPYRNALEHLFRRLRPRTVLDVGCGFFEPYASMCWGDVTYVGVDVVPDVVERNRSRYSTPTRRFIHADATDRVALPGWRFDVVLVKDVLQHWSLSRIIPFMRFLETFPHVVITNSTNGVRENWDIPDGQFRGLDVRLPPINLPAEELCRYEVVENPQFDLKTVLHWQPALQPWHPPGISLNVLTNGLY
jgi:SAM-dependent methyltransferase